MERIFISAYTPSDPAKSKALKAHRLSKPELLINILKKLALYWGLAFLTFFIPVYDLFLVPFFLIAGVYVAIKVEQAKYFISRGHIECPHCNHNIHLKKALLTKDFQVTCPHCVNVVKIDVRKTPHDRGLSAHTPLPT
jgi:hypothetical protein